MTNLISDRYERRCFNDDFRHRNSQYWRYLLLPPRQKAKLSTKTCTRCKSIPTTCKICTWCKSIPTTCKICTWCKILREVGFFVYRGSFRFRFALFTRAQGVPFLHTIGRTSNRYRFSVLSLWGLCCPLHPLLWAYAVHDRLHKYNPLRLVV